ncbi:hypothetical protein GGD81_004603 [Rhodobium orientis]|nr:hypothetical protein [Rhodobium orientis]MBB4305523.1 hypothetical protein [Rhodobium orientis]
MGNLRPKPRSYRKWRRYLYFRVKMRRFSDTAREVFLTPATRLTSVALSLKYLIGDSIGLVDLTFGVAGPASGFEFLLTVASVTHVARWLKKEIDELLRGGKD